MSRSIGVLGPEGTFSEKAARKYSPGADLRYFRDFEEVIAAVEGGEVDIGVVPLENSLEGSVGMTLDALLCRDVKITGEINLRVRHCLLGVGRSEEVKVILSHPQALAQCRGYLKRRFPEAELRTTGSTSHAAKLAQEFSEMAAIADAEAAGRYGLSVIERDVQDSDQNVTRFVVVGREAPEPTGRDKTSLAVYLERAEPGSLWEVLGEFATRGINLTRIESRPSKRGLGDYYFFIDLEGHVKDPQVEEALARIRERAAMTKVLGSYPRTDLESAPLA
ncbi:MAG TPA: prephenate dehydratase [Methanothrix sp.]|nr:prephenate dehydratase [Methanothrix sp.]